MNARVTGRAGTAAARAQTLRARAHTPRGRYLLLIGSIATLWALSSFSFTSLSGRNDFNLYLSYALLALGFYWIYGLSGQFSFAHAGFAAVGAYTSGWLCRQSLPLVAAVLVATLITAALAALIIVMLRRASGFYFAIATLGLGSLIVFVLQNWDAFTGGTDGQTAVPVLSWGGRPMSSTQISTTFLCVLTLGLVIAALIDLSPVRREATALKYRPDVARVCGVPDLALRMSMFSLGCGAAALSGALQGHSNGFLATDSFGTELGVGVFLMIVVGGENYLLGPLVGAAFYVFFPRFLQDAGMGDWQNFLYGAALLVFMIFMPAGILGGLDRLRAVVTSLQPRRAAVRPHARAGQSSSPARPQAAQAIDSPGVADPDLAVPRLSVRHLRVSFGGVRAVDDIDLRLEPGEILGLVGPNGSGKSTTLNALNGLVRASGEVRIDGVPCELSNPGATRGQGLVRAFQTPQIYPELSCIDNVVLADSDRRGTSTLSAVFRPWSVRRREVARADRARQALSALGVEALAEQATSTLSYGQQRWVELSRSIVAGARIVLLDEPSAGLNDEETSRLGEAIRLLRDHGASVIVVDHKVDFISSTCARVVVLDFGKIIAQGAPTDVFANPAVVEAYVGSHSGSDVDTYVDPTVDVGAGLVSP